MHLQTHRSPSLNNSISKIRRTYPLTHPKSKSLRIDPKQKVPSKPLPSQMKKNCSTRNSSLVSTSTRPRLLRKRARPINKRKHLYRISSSNITNNMFLCQVNKDSRPDSSRTAFKCHSKLSRVSFKTTREHLIFYQGLEILKMNCSNLVIHYLFRVLTHNPVKWIQM